MDGGNSLLSRQEGRNSQGISDDGVDEKGEAKAGVAVVGEDEAQNK